MEFYITACLLSLSSIFIFEKFLLFLCGHHDLSRQLFSFIQLVVCYSSETQFPLFCSEVSCQSNCCAFDGNLLCCLWLLFRVEGGYFWFSSSFIMMCMGNAFLFYSVCVGLLRSVTCGCAIQCHKSVATCSYWLPFWQMEGISCPSLQKILLDGTVEGFYKFWKIFSPYHFK